MDNPEKKSIIGILGGIGSGKSTVAAEFGKLGCVVINADKITHDLLATAEIQKLVVDVLGNHILDQHGKIDRVKLGAIVFNDSRKLSALNEILHPLVLARVEELLAEYNSQNSVKIIVLDMPLLVEVGWDKRCDYLVFVDCNEKIRGDRAIKKGHINKKQLEFRENFQISLDNKRKLSDNTIDNNSGFSALLKQVENIYFYLATDN